MATHFGGVGNTSMENPETQDVDNVSENDLQDENIVQKITSQDSTSKAIHRG